MMLKPDTTNKMELKLRPTPLTDSLIRGDDAAFNFCAFEMLEHARKMERERDYLLRHSNRLSADLDAVAEEACQLQDALGFPCETEKAQEKAMERLRDLIAAEGELGDARQLADDLWEMLKESWTAMRSAWNRMDTIREQAPEIYLESDMANLAAPLPHLRNPYTDMDIDAAVLKFRSQNDQVL